MPFPLNEPVHVVSVEFYLYSRTAVLRPHSPCPGRCFQKLIDELLIILRLDPCGSDTHVDFRRIKALRLHISQRFRIDTE